MDRREFFRLGLLRARDHAQKSVPDIIRSRLEPVSMDVSILAERAETADMRAREILMEHFSGKCISLKQSRLQGVFRGGILLFEQNTLRDYRDGASLFYASLSELEKELRLGEMQRDPTLLRYVNIIPSFSRSAEVYHKNRLLTELALTENAEHVIEGSRGPLTIIVDRMRLSVQSAPCDNGICVAHPAIITPGQRITCVPSEISIIIGSTVV